VWLLLEYLHCEGRVKHTDWQIPGHWVSDWKIFGAFWNQNWQTETPLSGGNSNGPVFIFYVFVAAIAFCVCLCFPLMLISLVNKSSTDSPKREFDLHYFLFRFIEPQPTPIRQLEKKLIPGHNKTELTKPITESKKKYVFVRLKQTCSSFCFPWRVPKDSLRIFPSWGLSLLRTFAR